MIGNPIKQIIKGIADPAASVLTAKERTKQILSIGRAYAAVASGLWRPWLAESSGWSMIVYVAGTLLLTLWMVYGVTMQSAWIGDFTIHDVKDFWVELGVQVFWFAGLFLTTYAASRGVEKFAAIRPDGAVAKTINKIKAKIGAEEVRRDIVDYADKPTQRIHGYQYEYKKPTTNPVNQVAESLIDLQKLRSELMRDEGYKLEIYKDTEGHKTAGIGHKLVPNDPEYAHPVGTEISAERAQQWFKSDMAGAIDDVKKLFPNIGEMPFDLRHVLVNLMFNLGYTRFKQFTKTRAFLDAQQWDLAAAELLDSKYAKQVGPRADRLSARIAALSDGQLIIG